MRHIFLFLNVLNNKTVKDIVKSHSAAPEIQDNNSTCTQWTCTQSHHPIKKSALCIIQGRARVWKCCATKSWFIKAGVSAPAGTVFPLRWRQAYWKCVRMWIILITRPSHALILMYTAVTGRVKRGKEKNSVMFTHRNECHNQRFCSMVKDGEREVVLTQQLKLGAKVRGLNEDEAG